MLLLCSADLTNRNARSTAVNSDGPEHPIRCDHCAKPSPDVAIAREPTIAHDPTSSGAARAPLSERQSEAMYRLPYRPQQGSAWFAPLQRERRLGTAAGSSAGNVLESRCVESHFYQYTL